MKKIKLALTTLFVLILGICCLSACNSSVEGTYKFYSLSYTEGGVSVELKAGEQFMGMITLDENFMTVTLESGGTVKMSSSMDEGMTGTGTWKMDGTDKVIITVNGEPQTFTLSGSQLIVNEDGMKVVLKK